MFIPENVAPYPKWTSRECKGNERAGVTNGERATNMERERRGNERKEGMTDGKSD